MKLFLFSLLIGIFLTLPLQVIAESCGAFHKKVGDKCVKFDVPSNAHITYSGNNWECNRGFRKSEDDLSCIEIKIPANATANWINSFHCNSGYKKEGDECVKVPDVENGRFYEFGADFYCEKGYQKNETERKCEKIKIPANAKEDSSSLNGWRCFGGYIKDGNECKKFILPERAYWTGDFWRCEQGYRKNLNNNTCEKIYIPENAHSADTFDGWVCDSGYTKNYRENRCDKNEN